MTIQLATAAPIKYLEVDIYAIVGTQLVHVITLIPSNYCRDLVGTGSNYRDSAGTGFLWCPSTNPDRTVEGCRIKQCGSDAPALVKDGFDMKRCRNVTDADSCLSDEEVSCKKESSSIAVYEEEIEVCSCCFRRVYVHDCYIPTDKDRSHPSLPDSPTPKQLCELQPNRFFMDSTSDDYPGCKDCSCCQRKECYKGPPQTYNGTWLRTISGHLCADWSTQMQTLPGRNPSIDPHDSRNCCRGRTRIWIGDDDYYHWTTPPNACQKKTDNFTMIMNVLSLIYQIGLYNVLRNTL